MHINTYVLFSVSDYGCTMLKRATVLRLVNYQACKLKEYKQRKKVKLLMQFQKMRKWSGKNRAAVTAECMIQMIFVHIG